MADGGENLMEKLELQSQEYSVLITDSRESSYGSGVLFFPGRGENLYVFTCAHVVEDTPGKESGKIIKSVLSVQIRIRWCIHPSIRLWKIRRGTENTPWMWLCSAQRRRNGWI